MITKKIAIIFALAMACIGMKAQLPVGGWTIHSPFGGVSTIAETKNIAYYLSAGSLFSVDKATNEVRSLNISNDLNGGAIKGIYPHPDGKYLVVAYTDCNIDRINDDGSVINISDISDALITGKPAINHVGFGKDRIYVATTFGLVTINDLKNETVETMFSPSSVDFVHGLGDHVVIGYEKKLLAAPASEHLVSIDKFNLVGANANVWTFGDKSMRLGDNRLIFTHKSGSNNLPIVADFDFDADKLSYTITKQNNSNFSFTALAPIGKDKLFVTNGSTMLTFGVDTPANSPEVTTLPSILKDQQMSAFDGLGKLWGGNADGICQYDITDRANPVQLGEKFGMSSFTTPNTNRIIPQASGNILFANVTESCGAVLGFSGKPQLKLTSYNQATKFSPIAFSPTVSEACWATEDPNNPNILYVSTFRRGVIKYNNGIQEIQFDKNNSAIRFYVYYGVSCVAFDSFNNLWVGQEDAANGKYCIHAISYADLNKAEPQKEDWKTFESDRLDRSSTCINLSKSKMMAFAQGAWKSAIHFIKQKGTATLDDDELIVTRSYVDQDNKQLSFAHIISLCEDKKGRLWVGTDNGIFEITDPSKINSDVATVNHLKVPRNDGTGLADYLMDAIQVNSIAVDNSNRKWIATATAGVYLVSEDGDRIIEHYDMNNSILPSNRVFSVACDPNSSSVFFATDAGVVEYNSTSAPASENLDDVYAYPNPVRPDYSGWITVTGLMDNTLVKIADSAGNVFFQGRSEGGMITWDGCNANGDRVKTGVYYVFASHGSSSDSGSDNCVTKIMVIN